jgi:hypothetical protein
METQKVLINSETAPVVVTDRAEAKGVLSPPAGMPAIERVLSVTGSATANAKANHGAFSVSGQVTLLVLYQEGGRTHGFTSTADYSREIKAQDVTEGSLTNVHAAVGEIHYALEGGAVAVSATVLLCCLGSREESVYALTNLGPNAEQLFTDIECRTFSQTTDELTLKDDLRLPRAASEILGCLAFCRVNGVSQQLGNASVNGQLHLDLLATGMDGSPEWLPFTLPFEATIPLESPADELSGDVMLTGVTAELIGDDTASVDASVTVRLLGGKKEMIRTLADAYSTEYELHLERMTIRPCRMFCAVTRGNVRLEAPLPMGYPNAERVIFASLRPVMGDCMARDGEMRASGTMYASVLYLCSKGDLHSFDCTLPFEAALSAPMLKEGMGLFAHADAECVHASGMQDTIVIQSMLDCSAVAWEAGSKTVIVDVGEGKRRGGLYGPVVYFPNKGETPWDVGRRFGVPLAELAKLNPGADKALPEAVLLNLRRVK